MKHNIHLHQLFDKLNLEDIPVEDNSTLLNQVDAERIHQLTMKKIQKDRKLIFPFQRQLFKAALTACIVLCISGATVFAAANEAVRETISSLLGISQTEILAVGKSIESKDYKLFVHEIACDSYTGIVTISVEALSPKAKKTFMNDIIIHKLGHLGSVGYGLGELEDLQNGYTRYFSFSFNVGNARYKDSGLNFSMEGISKKIKIPITQTIKLAELDIEVPTTYGYSVSYQKLYYSELGFTLLGKLENEDFNNENSLIMLEFMDGSTSKFYHYFNEHEDPMYDNDLNAAEAPAITNDIETSVTNATAVSPESNNIIDFDNEWFSGGGVSCDTGIVTSIFSFSKKMDWSTVKSITVNGTTIRIK